MSHLQAYRLVFITFVVSSLLLALLVSVTTSSFSAEKIAGLAIVPQAAVRDSLQVSANHLHSFQVVAERGWGIQRLLLYTYIVQQGHNPPHQEFGFARTELRVGWSTILGQTVAISPQQTSVTYATAILDGYPLMYGIVRDTRVQQIIVDFEPGVSANARPTQSGFLIVGPIGSRFHELRLYDAQDQLLQHYEKDTISEPSTW